MHCDPKMNSEQTVKVVFRQLFFVLYDKVPSLKVHMFELWLETFVRLAYDLVPKI